jgi:glycosyltransferase involved in cell wall biosynthesis/GT2 family glycosyltransferase
MLELLQTDQPAGPPRVSDPVLDHVGVVVIGRNEGERLRRCLDSLPGVRIVYVDSGSTDGSVELCRSRSIAVVELDLSVPFTAARARNAGAAHLLRADPHLQYIQFVDGDCEVCPGWLERAEAALTADASVAAVCGWVRERYPERTIYNRLCGMDWNGPVGLVDSCGGNALMRARAFTQAAGFCETLIAGEEPELCSRLRGAGWRVVRLDAEMVLHDAAMTRFRQWWRRVVRCGYAFAAVSQLRGPERKRIWTREVRSNWFWGAVLPLAILAVLPFVPLAALVLAAGYLVLGLRIYRGRRRNGMTRADARLYSAFCVLAKFPLALGQAHHLRDRLLKRSRTLIEYKGMTSQDAAPSTSQPGARPRIAYLVNQYPHVSHSFIRREIRAVEELGAEVLRVSIRRPDVKLVDPGDIEEQARTRILLGGGLAGLVSACAWTALTHPVRWLRSAALAWRLGRRSGRLLRAAVYFAEACLLVRWLRRERIEHLHAHFGTNPADVAALARALGGPSFSFTVHGPEEFDRPDAIALGEKIARAAFVVAISSFGRSQLFRWCRAADWPKVRVVRCGVDAAFLDGGPLPPSAEPRLVCVARLAEQKGQLVLVDAAARLAARGIGFQLVLAGDGPMRPQIEAAIAAHGLGDRVRITGWLSNDAVRREMVAARFVVLPSFAEGLPVVLMEALAVGRPVITTYVAGIPELVRAGVNGWLVPAGDPVALAEALAGALSAGPEQLAEMGRAGASAVAAAHDVRVEAKKLLAHFNEATGRAVPVGTVAGGA